MKIFDWIKEKLGFDEDEYEVIFDGFGVGDDAEAMTEILKRSSLKRERLNVLDYKEREQFVRDRCEQMTECSKDVEEQKIEYQTVTEHLSDIEEILSLPDKDRKGLFERAWKILSIEEEEKKYERPASKISDKQYREIERMENEIPEILRKMKESEDYQQMVKRDLNLLEGEKGALAYQRKEMKNRAANAKTGCLILVFATVMVFCLLLFVKLTMRVDTKLGFVILAGVLAVALTLVYITYKNAVENSGKLDKKINRAISIQNKTKVKYVNATNLLDYYYNMYNVDNSYELRYMWDKYLEEKNARNHSEEVALKMENARRNLLNLLKQFRIKEPALFVYQPSLLTEKEEIEELRHSLVIQRQRLKKGIDYNMENMEEAKRDIESLVRQYPEYAREILGIVSMYE